MSRTRLGSPPALPAGRIRNQDAYANTAGPSADADNFKALRSGVRVQQYELIRELGRGGMGVVFAARDTRLGRRVAIKFLLDSSGPIAERFMVEARATAQCTHPNIVVIHEVGELERRPYMVLEFLEGKTLREKLIAPGIGRLPASRVLELMLPVAHALARAAELGITHRDLKPENVFVTESGQIKVLDFGIAKARGVEDLRTQIGVPANVDPMLTTAGSLVGTLPYMAPEQVRGEEVDARTDLWAMGVMMFEMLAGRHPVEPFTVDRLLASLLGDDPYPQITEAVPDVPPPLARIIDQCLRKRKAERLTTALELVRRLEQLLPGRRMRELAEGESPYPGLAAFQEHDSDRFFGRSREIARLTAMVRELPITAVVGPSGVGKSSIVRAGVGPALQASGEDWEVVTVRPGRLPIWALAGIVQRLTTRDTGPVDQRIGQQGDLVEQLAKQPGYLGELLRARATETGHNILVFVDQFEELYTLVAESSERLAFTAALAGIADDIAAPLRVIVSMRADFLDRVAEDAAFLSEISRGLMVLGPTDRAGLREALVKPLQMVGHSFESPAIVEEMLEELDDTQGALPLLQFIATKLWDARDAHEKVLTERAYRLSGGVLGALATHADSVITNLSPAARSLAPELFRRLVTPERTRAIAELADLEQLSPNKTLVTRLIEQLVTARLLTVHTRETVGATVELVHESLIERWPTLQRWLDEANEDAAFRAGLAASAKQWDAKGRSQGLLWRGEAADEAYRWRQHHQRELAERDGAFLAAVLALQHRSRRLRRIALVGAFAALGAVAAGASFGFVQVRAANETAQRNEQAAQAALTAKTKEESARIEAEKNRAAAIASLLTAEQRQQAAEQGLLDAKQSAAQAEAKAREAEAEARDAQIHAAQAAAQMTKEQLVDKNKELEAALAAAKAAREKAERATAKAEEASAEANRARAQLQQKLADESARVQKLEDQKKQISTKLR